MNDYRQWVAALRDTRDLPDEALRTLLETDAADELLREAADAVRRERYGDAVYVRGLIEFTNYCKNDCYYCGIRHGNRNASRYRLELDDILSCCREGYALGYKAAWKTARWVMYRLTDDEVVTQVARRSDVFAPDPLIPNGPQLDDYRGSGYDRGHLAPAADMKWSRQAMTECFYLSNMVPQDRGNNSGIWNEIENTVRGFACAEGSVFVVTGPVTPDPPALSIGKGRVAVPTELWKVVYDETPPKKMIGFIVPNRNVKGKPRDYACSVEEVERRTGLKFFPKLSGKDSLKTSFDASAWDWSKSQRKRVASDGIRAYPARSAVDDKIGSET